MKRMIYGLTMASLVALTGGCEKENPAPVASGVQSQKPEPPSGNTEKSFAIVLSNPLSSYSCNSKVCNAQDIGGFRYNLIQVSNNHAPTTIKYALYEVTQIIGFPGLELGNLIAQFNCNLATTQYAGSLLNNNAKIMVYAMHTTDTAPLTVVLSAGVLGSQIPDSDYEIFIMGNNEGAPGCGPIED